MNEDTVDVGGFPFEPLLHVAYTPGESLERARGYEARMARRRSVRDFVERPVTKELIEKIINTASSAPSGANKQPWTFCAICDPELKSKIRSAAEREEKLSYDGRMSQEWLEDLAPLGTDWRKPFLEVAPWLIVVFKQAYGIAEDGGKRQHYYVNESVGIACGLLIAAIHEAGLVTLTHTPSPMGFLKDLLKRPDNERPFLLLPVGYPEEGALVPAIGRKSLEQVTVFFEGAEG